MERACRSWQKSSRTSTRTEMRLRHALIACVLAATPLAADFAADEYPPYERCALCHGLFGVSHIAKFPNLAGQKPDYIAAQIKAFHAGQRTNDGGQMAAIVTELKPEEIPIVVEWFSTQAPPKPLGIDLDSKASAHYADLGCDSCHADPGNMAPHLTAQHPQYLEKQMSDFLSGARAGSDIARMHQVLLREAEIKAISLYLAGKARP